MRHDWQKCHTKPECICLHSILLHIHTMYSNAKVIRGGGLKWKTISDMIILRFQEGEVWFLIWKVLKKITVNFTSLLCTEYILSNTCKNSYIYLINIGAIIRYVGLVSKIFGDKFCNFNIYYRKLWLGYDFLIWILK